MHTCNMFVISLEPQNSTMKNYIRIIFFLNITKLNTVGDVDCHPKKTYFDS